MKQKDGKFTISFTDLGRPTAAVETDGISFGRLDTCEVVLDHPSVSRIHAGINFRDSKYFLVNLSTSNILTLNGRLLGPQKSDVLADGEPAVVGLGSAVVHRRLRRAGDAPTLAPRRRRRRRRRRMTSSPPLLLALASPSARKWPSEPHFVKRVRLGGGAR